VPSRLSLTSEQRRAAATSAPRAFIIAAPGSGKTTVAAERYGVVRYNGAFDSHRILALSFARSAKQELAERIRWRWGSAALAWPHEAVTLDGLHRELVTYLLRTGVIQWPGGHTELTVIDTWRGQAGARYLLPVQQFRRVAALNDTQVTSTRRAITTGVYGIGRRDAFEAHLASGLCTHEEIREVLRAVLLRADLQPTVTEYLTNTVKAIVVDEIFDANNLDLAIVQLASAAGIPTTLIGDPWQALYDFRGARPDLVPRLVARQGFATFPVTQSFRFETPKMQRLAARLRAGQPVTLPRGAAIESNIVLASYWDTLWDGAECVLPLSFGRIDNQTDAAITILLDRLVSGHFGHGAIYGTEAITLLGLDLDVVRADGPAALSPVLETLSVGTPEATMAAIRQLRAALRALGSPRQLRSLPGSSEASQLGRLQALARRMTQPMLVPGMTVHQAKGREWPIVGVRLTDAQVEQLGHGLSQDSPEDRVLYVAITRACRAAQLL
jgi:DNA helicase-2/ATP-dependent DNA helicase PcrA